MADDDYYRILELKRDCSDADIKKAYRKLALKWHPDKNPGNKEHAEEMFKKIGEAYEVLSDSRKRSDYDKYGKAVLYSNVGARSYGEGDDINQPHHWSAGTSVPFGTAFTFTHAEDIFRDFFEHDPFGDDILSEFLGYPRQRSKQHSGAHAGFSMVRDPFMNFSTRHGASFDAHDGFFSGAGFPYEGSGLSGSFDSGFKSTSKTYSSTSTKTVNGKKITTKKIVKNGEETIEVYEDGNLTSRSVKPCPQISDGKDRLQDRLK